MTTPDPLHLELRDLAATLAVEAGDDALRRRDDVIASAETKSSATDLVTEADRAAEAHIIAGITAARPDDGIVGEEGGERASTTGLSWFIDPIDGTTNFVYGIPDWAVSIAVAEIDPARPDQPARVVAAAVADPGKGLLYTAALGAGAQLEGATIRCSTTTDLSLSLVGTGFSYLAERRRHQASVIGELLPSIRDIRRHGAAALDLCSVAAGRLDAYFELGLNSWDLAAGWLVATEAGAIVDDLRGGSPSPTFTFATTPGIATALGDELRRIAADQPPAV